MPFRLAQPFFLNGVVNIGIDFFQNPPGIRLVNPSPQWVFGVQGGGGCCWHIGSPACAKGKK
jgi:hypothetical protein